MGRSSNFSNSNGQAQQQQRLLQPTQPTMGGGGNGNQGRGPRGGGGRGGRGGSSNASTGFQRGSPPPPSVGLLGAAPPPSGHRPRHQRLHPHMHWHGPGGSATTAPPPHHQPVVGGKRPRQFSTDETGGGGRRSSPSPVMAGRGAAGQQQQQQQQPPKRAKARGQPQPQQGALNCYVCPREGEGPLGVAFGFNYWVHTRTQILASDAREAVLGALTSPTAHPHPPFIRPQELTEAKTVVLATVTGIPSSQVVSELPSCPFLSQLSSAPTRYAAAFDANLRPEHFLPASAALLWMTQEPAPLSRLAGLPLAQTFREYVLFLSCGDAQTTGEDEWLVLRPGDLGKLEAMSVKSEPSEEGEVDEEEENGDGGAADARGYFHRRRGGEQGTWSLKKGGKELTLKWTNPTPAVASYEPDPNGWEVFTDGGASLAFSPSPHSQPPPSVKQLTVVRAIHVDLYEGLTAPPPPDVALLLPGSSGVEQHDGGEDGDEGGKGTTLLLGLPQLSALVRGRLDGAGMAAFALTEEERLRQRYPVSLAQEGPGWVSSSSSASSSSPCAVLPSLVDGGGEGKHKRWGPEEGFETGGWVSESEEEEEEEEEGSGGDDGVKEEEEDGVVVQEEEARDQEGPWRLWGIDCEMCLTEDGLELTRVTIVGEEGAVVLDTLVRPAKPIEDYRTEYSGVGPKDLESCRTTLADVQAELLRRLAEQRTFLVGHALDGDLRALRLLHPHLIDTAVLYPHPRGSPYKRSLRDLAREFLNGREIQQGHGVGGHDSYQDAATALELALLKMLKGHDYCVPGPWAHEPSPPREPIFKPLRRFLSSSAFAPAIVNVVGPYEGGVLGDAGTPEASAPPLSRTWAAYQRGYRREGDAVWVATKTAEALSGEEGLMELRAHPCGTAAAVVAKGVELLQESAAAAAAAAAGARGREGKGTEEGEHEGAEALAPALLWLDIPFTEHYTPSSLAAGGGEGARRHFTSLRQVDAALASLAAAAPAGTLLVVAVQGDAHPLYSLMEAKQRCRWDKPSGGQRQGIAGTERAPWTEEDESALQAHAKEAVSGVMFWGLKRRG